MKRERKTPIDSQKWCRYILIGGNVGVALIAFAHVVWYFTARSWLRVSPDDYLKYFIVAPTVGLSAVNLLVWLLVRSARVPMRVKEYLSSFLFAIYALYLIMSHDIAVVVLCTFMLPIFISAVFSNRTITSWVFAASIASLALFALRMQGEGKLDSGMIMQIFVASVLFVSAYLLALILIQHYDDNMAAIVRSTEEARRNEMAFLQAQIKPHFIYNVLNTIIAFCYTDGNKAAELLVDFSTYLRQAFDTDPDAMMVPLRKELELIRAFVSLETARFGDDIRVDWSIDPSLENLAVPSFCLQPLVENAIKYGQCKKSGNLVRVSAETDGRRVVLRVADTGAGMPSEKLEQLRGGTAPDAGVGFYNVLRRVEGWGGHLDIQSTEGKGTTVTITAAVTDKGGTGLCSVRSL